MTFWPKILVLLEFQFLCPRANFGVYFMLEAYFDLKFVFGRKKNVGKFIRELKNKSEF